MNAIHMLLLGVFAAALVLGAAAQASRFCLQGGMREAMLHGDNRRLAAYAAAVAIAIALVGLLQMVLGQAIHPARPAYTSPELAWGRYLIGGLLFGTGMILARGCPLRTLVHVGQGNAQAMVVLVIMALSAYAMTRTNLYANAFAPWLGTWSMDLRTWGFDHQDLATLLGLSAPGARLMLSLLLAALLFGAAWRYLPLRANRRMVAGAFFIGIAVAAGYALTAGKLGTLAMDEASFMTLPPDGMGIQSYTFSGPLGDTVYFFLHPSTQTFSFGVMAIAGALAGALISSALRRELHWQAGFETRVMLRRCIGAVLAGGGAVLALGCTVGNGLSGLSVLSIGSMLALAAVLFSAWATLKLETLLTRRPVHLGVAGSAA